jgi:hypothetical protein
MAKAKTKKAKPKAKPKKVAPKKSTDRWFDDALRLALLDEVFSHTDRDFDEFEAAYRRRAKGKRAPSWDSIAEQSEPRHNKLLEQLLLEQPISAKDLGAIDSLTLDGDRDVYAYVFPFWWDCGDAFTIRDLRDLARCTALTKVSLGQGLVEGCSLAPLEDLPVLRELSMCTSGDYKDIESLVDLPSLQQIEVVNLANDKSGLWKPTIEKLVAKGVRFKTW